MPADLPEQSQCCHCSAESLNQGLHCYGLEGNTCLDKYKQQTSTKIAWSLWTVWIVKELHLETKLFIVSCSPSFSSKWSHTSELSTFSNKTSQSGTVPLPHFHSHAIMFTTSMHLSLHRKYAMGSTWHSFAFLFLLLVWVKLPMHYRDHTFFFLV